MGRTAALSTYSVTVCERGYAPTKMVWHCPTHGRPTNEGLAAFVMDYEASTKLGGVNAHLGPAVVRSATIRRQLTQEVVASYTQPMFAVV